MLEKPVSRSRHGNTESCGDLRIEIVQPIDAAGTGERGRSRDQNGKEGRIGRDNEKVASMRGAQKPDKDAEVEGQVIQRTANQMTAPKAAGKNAMDHDAANLLLGWE